MRMVKRTRIPILAVAACLLTTAPASAAFFPDLTLGIEPPNAATAPALTATITQPAADSAIQRFTLSLPKGFRAANAPGASECAPAAVAAARCGAATRIGTVDGRIGNAIGFSGTIHKLAGGRFAAVVSALNGSIAQVIPGSLTKRADGALDLRLDQLPALALTSLSFRFEGGDRSLVRTPATCGEYDVDGKFTSRAGELALDRTTVPVTGCSGVPAIQVANVRMSRPRFRAGGSPLAYRTIIAWWASRAVDHTNVRIERRTGERWRVVGVLVGTGAQGENRIRWDGRVGNRALRRGTYGVRVQPAGSAPSKLVRFRIL